MSSLVLLHGFMGSARSWDGIAPGSSRVLSPVLVGHGPNPDGAPEPREPAPRFEDEVDRLAAVIVERGFAGSHLAGYSLGGRLALGLLARHPTLFESATLVSARDGLEDERERSSRAQQDEQRAERLEQFGLEAFVAEWERLPLFSTQTSLSVEVRDRQREARLAHTASGLARSLRQTGLGRMPVYARELGEMRIPVDLVVGEADRKFCSLAVELSRRIERARVTTIASAGHNLLLERPRQVGEVILRSATRADSGGSQ